MIYKVTVDQTFSDIYRTIFEVEANSEKEALENYWDGYIIDSERIDSCYDDREPDKIINVELLKEVDNES